ncbi:hypothetical protein Rsub_02207 [Raphidocelis subcapitata]|uniref:Uncharacterized protein n=1 Tax=Raphidocelis subcapitata TaxID=307507 RepID=A0A2V0NUT2_9CHLO|nr:hypothetical protein Rsub_02207 [Raphidocelis subcapitata]|eukprot:GBF89330.1 hypothetical protein Rsub_02207 [Raphidocelis subcapitata]
MAREDEGSDSYDDYATSSGEDGAPSGRLLGNMKTQLRWLPDCRAMVLNVRQIVESQRGVEIKYKGSLNTSTGEFSYRAQLRKPFFTNTPSIARIMAAERGVELREDAEGAKKIDARGLLPAGAPGLLWRDWSIAPGVALSSDPKLGFAYTLAFRKQPQIIRRGGEFDSWLGCKGVLEYNPQTQQVGAYGNARLKIFRFGLTTTQDARVSIGYDWRATPAGGWGSAAALASGDGDGDGGSDGGAAGEGGFAFSKTPYLKVADADWAVRWSGKAVNFTYLI